MALLPHMAVAAAGCPAIPSCLFVLWLVVNLATVNHERRATLRDIAERAGVDRSTVSLALHNDPSIPESTRRRIRKAANELGYRPDPVVSTLMAHLRTHKPVKHLTTLAFITSFPTRDGWRKMSQITRDYHQGAVKRAAQLGYQVEEIWARESGMTRARLTQILLTRSIRGLLVAPVYASRGHLSLDWSQFAAATFGYSICKPEMSRAAMDHYQCVMLALRQLRRLGYHRMGLAIQAALDERVDNRFQAAVLAYQARHPSTGRVRPLVSRNWNEQQFRAWFRRSLPDVVLGVGAQIPVWLQRSGLRIPNDVGFVHLHWEEGDPSWAGVRHNGEEVGAATADLVIHQLQHHEFGIPARPTLVLVRGDWVDGDTVRLQTRG